MNKITQNNLKDLMINKLLETDKKPHPQTINNIKDNEVSLAIKVLVDEINKLTTRIEKLEK